MKKIDIDEDLYSYIASNTQHIGESASSILRRLLGFDAVQASTLTPQSVEPVQSPQQTTQTTFSERPAAAQTVLVGPDDGSFSNTHEDIDLIALVSSQRFTNMNTAIERFMTVLSNLYHADSHRFETAIQAEASAQQHEKARTRLYFADNPDILLASGKTTKPKPIPDTPFWVITNNNTKRKRQMVEHLMQRMEFSSNVIIAVCEAI